MSRSLPDDGAFNPSLIDHDMLDPRQVSHEIKIICGSFGALPCKNLIWYEADGDAPTSLFCSNYNVVCVL